MFVRVKTGGFYPETRLKSITCDQPCRCRWRESLQITRTTPLRRTILQFLHMRFTDALTFIILLPKMPGPAARYRGTPLRP
jgi:hypothetical protein